MPLDRRTAEATGILRRGAAIALWLGLLPAVAGAQVCDPPGPPPRFACQWSTDACDWFCPICDPFGSPPRTSCSWDLKLCNWICPGYTGTEVTVRTTQPPALDATVYVRLSSLCTATGVLGACSGSFPVYHGLSIAQKCQAIADVVANDCSTAGYAVTVNDCRLEGSITVDHPGCPATPFALGLSNDPAVFDQAGQGALPDGEVDGTTGTTSSCAPLPAEVANLHVGTVDGGTDLALTWDDAADADDYLVFSDTAPNGAFESVAGSAPDGSPGLTIGMQPGIEFYLVAGRNSSCGVGPRH